MPVNLVRRSIKAQQVAVDALAGVMSRLDWAGANMALPGALEMVPVYSISARNIVAGRWNNGWRSGWRYFWTHTDLADGVTVEVRRGKGDMPVLASISVGPGSKALSEELAKAAKTLASNTNRYRPRILRLPWIGMEAVWLNTDSLDVPDGFINRHGAPHDDAFREEAVLRAENFLKTYEEAEPQRTKKTEKAKTSLAS